MTNPLIALGPPVAAALVRLLGTTLRLRAEGIDALAPSWTAARPLIYCVWHGRILMVPWLNARLRRTHGAREVSVLASRSRDGGIVGDYARRFGLDVVRGSSSRGGALALRALVTAVGAGRDVALVPDGPRGPRGRLGPGVVALAALTGAPVVPLGFAARPAWRLATWDEFQIPSPFARAALVFGAATAIPRDADRERARKEIERSLDEATAAAERLVST
ncbi:MAG TPA: lysophospholipid acyltransferase family protein [Candidatus Binatia bacterium]|nr:lysophospholipid acyltransferase family protein [Candidatus Binatia bacterium]